MKIRVPVLFASVFFLLAACKPRQEAHSAVKGDQLANGRFVVAEPRPNPLKRTDFVDVAKKLEMILKDSGQNLAPGLVETSGGGDRPNGVASLASISWTLGDLKLASRALTDLGQDAGEAKKLEILVQRLDAELNKKASAIRNKFLLDSNQRDVEVAKNRQQALEGATNGAPADVSKLREARNEALNLAVQQVGELRTGAEGFPGMECDVVGGSPTALVSSEFSEEDTFEVGKALEASTARHLGRGEGVCFALTPGYPLFVLVTQKRCASGFQPEDPRVAPHSSADTGGGESFAYVLPPGEMLEVLCFSRSGEATMPVISQPPIQPPKADVTMSGAFKRMVSSIFSAPGDCEGVAQAKTDLCTNSECRAVTSGQISDCYSKDCRAIILQRSSACASTDCRGIIRRVIEDCVSNYCRAVVGNKPTECREGKTL